MSQALRSLNVPTELVIYPGQFHGFTRPSFIHDRYQRYFDWYNKSSFAAISPEIPRLKPSVRALVFGGLEATASTARLRGAAANTAQP